MIKKALYIILASITIGWFFVSCEEDAFLPEEGDLLAFSHDTVMFDTIFTVLGSTTQSFRVINPQSRPITVSSIRLAGGNDSFYRLNIDGDPLNEREDVVIPAFDSIYIFVEVTIDPNGVDQPLVVQDSVLFETGNTLQDVDLVAWGQDFNLIKGEVLQTQTWADKKPYVVYDYAIVDSGQVLTINPGTRIFFHDTAGMYVLGAIRAEGTSEEPILFAGDRLEEMYEDLPDQWQGIILFPNKMENTFSNVEIKNANIGLQVGTLEYEGSATAKLHNVVIQHMSYAGIFALKSKIEATNTLVADCGFYGVALLVGGSYDFNHTTIANYYTWKRNGPALVISNILIDSNSKFIEVYENDLTRANFKNSIIWGTQNSELLIGNSENKICNYNFDYCMVKTGDSIDTENYPDNFTNLVDDYSHPDSIKHLFIDPYAYNFNLDTLSLAKDAGKIEYGRLVPYDLNNVSRLEDIAPDLGAFERIEEETENEDTD
ncbi:MAG: hypothetical protein K9H26_15045 [Prolixibacteraceae bacterium]|nr:hypothetical protein [Prolixibacteraceae bacterium]